MTFQEAIKNIDGHIWTSEPDVAMLISALIKMHGCKHVLELGVFKGYTSCYMIDSIPLDGTYTGIDVADFRCDSVKKYMDATKSKFINGDSQYELPKLPEDHYDLIFIDSDHTYEHLSKEFKLCERIVKQDALIVIHDTEMAVLKKWIDYIDKQPQFQVINLNTSRNNGLTIVKMLWGKPFKTKHQ